MAGFDPKAYGIDSRTDVGLFLFIGGVVGVVDAVFNLAQSDPLTIAAVSGAAVVGLRKLLTGSESGRSPESDDARNRTRDRD